MDHKTSDAKRRANAKYDTKFDRVYASFPRGTRDRIMNIGSESVNSFVLAAILEKLEREESYRRT